MRLALGTAAMLVLTHASPNFLRRISPWLYLLGIVLLVVVELTGVIGKGAQRWLNLGLFKFQPSEIMKLAVPMLAAWYLHDRPLPPDWRSLLVVAVIIFLPAGLVAIQPDLGTAALISASGALLVLMAGLSMRIVGALALAGAGAAVLGWNFLHDYQRQRVLTFLNPQTDPLGAGYHIIQSQIALGSGGVFGKGWMNGRRNSSSCPSVPPISSSPWSARNSDSSAWWACWRCIYSWCREPSGSPRRPTTPTRDCWRYAWL
jgi:rod shape determining protein RodA